MPVWIHVLSIFSLIVAIACAFVIALDVKRHPQHMWIMNLVWPLVALFGSVAALWAYFRYGRLATAEAHHEAMQQDRKPPSQAVTPFAVMVGKGAAHCGSHFGSLVLWVVELHSQCRTGRQSKRSPFT